MPTNTTQLPTKADHAPLTKTLADKIRLRWDHSSACSFENLADAALDLICAHIRRGKKLDERIEAAIEEHLDHDPLEGDCDEGAECSIEDIEAWRGRMYARGNVENENSRIRKVNLCAELSKMLKKPKEAKRYNELRAQGYAPAGALHLILGERKVASMKTEPPTSHEKEWNGGAL